jgi:hypothetical protein
VGGWVEQQIRKGWGRTSNYYLGDLCEAASSPGHHDLELVEGDEAVAVLVDALDHAAALRDGGGLAEAAEDARELGGGDGAAAVGVEDAEGVAQVLLDGGRVAGHRGVEGRELGQADEAVAVRVRLGHHARHLVVRRAVAQALEQRRQLRPRDPPVAVRVELAEHARHLLLRRRPLRGPVAVAVARGRRLLLRLRRRRLGGAAAEQGRHGHPDLAHVAWREGAATARGFGWIRHGCGFGSAAGGVFVEAKAEAVPFPLLSITDRSQGGRGPGRKLRRLAVALALRVPALWACVWVAVFASHLPVPVSLRIPQTCLYCKGNSPPPPPLVCFNI